MTFEELIEEHRNLTNELKMIEDMCDLTSTYHVHIQIGSDTEAIITKLPASVIHDHLHARLAAVNLIFQKKGIEP